MTTGKRLRQGVETAGFRLLAAAVRGLPRRGALALGSSVGRFAFDVVGIRRSISVRNVTERLAATEEEARDIARASYSVMGRTFVDLLRGDRTTDEVMWILADRSSFRPLVDIHEQGRGGVLVSGHFGNWELLVIAIRRLGLPVAAMAADQSNPAVNAVLRDLRRRAGVEPLSARSGLRDAVQWIRAGGFVATLMDQDARRKGVFVDFLGAPASTHIGVPSLAARTGAPLVPGVLVESGNRYEFRMGPLVRFPGGGTDDELRHAAIAYNRWLAEEVRRAPENYFWAHRRWKTRPRIVGQDEGDRSAGSDDPPKGASA